MRSFKRALRVTAVTALLCALLSALVFEGYYQTTQYIYMDAGIRRELAGSVDTLFCCSSQGKNALVPAQYDLFTGANSYNLGGAQITMEGRYTLLKQELSRNPVKTVYLELSFESMSRNRRSEGIEGDLYLLARLDNPLQRMAYFLTHFHPGEWRQTFHQTFRLGLLCWQDILTGNLLEPAFAETKGFQPEESVDLTLSRQMLAACHHAETAPAVVRPENLRALEKIVALCREKDVRLVLLTVPISPTLIWKTANLDEIHDQLADFARANDLEYYDFNLYRNGYYAPNLFFVNERHMSQYGAEPFTRNMADLMARVDAGEDVTGLFYPSYAALETDRAGADGLLD